MGQQLATALQLGRRAPHEGMREKFSVLYFPRPQAVVVVVEVVVVNVHGYKS